MPFLLRKDIYRDSTHLPNSHLNAAVLVAVRIRLFQPSALASPELRRRSLVPLSANLWI
jgi:hypothetical protein